MSDAWEMLKNNSSLSSGDAWEHLNNQSSGDNVTNKVEIEVSNNYSLNIDLEKISLDINLEKIDSETKTIDINVNQDVIKIEIENPVETC